VAIVRIIREAPLKPAKAGHPKVELVEVGGELRVVFPYAPKLTADGLARRFVTQDRTGRAPLLGSSGPDLKRISFSALFGNLDHQEPIEGRLSRLERMAARGKRVRFRNYGPAEGGWYRITSLSIEDVVRQQGTNLRTRATVSMTVTEASDVDLNVGPASGGHKNKSGGKDGDKSESAWPKHYRIKAGDTLAGIAARFYDDPDKWHRIADANEPPRLDPRHMKVGRRLTIPRP
jgi:LysM domain